MKMRKILRKDDEMKNQKFDDLQRVDGKKPSLIVKILVFLVTFVVSFSAFYLMQYLLFR